MSDDRRCFPERRSAHRFDASPQASLDLPLAHPVRILEVGRRDVLLESNVTVDVGLRGELRLDLRGRSLASRVEVTRVSSMTGRYLAAAVFIDTPTEELSALERFIND